LLTVIAVDGLTIAVLTPSAVAAVFVLIYLVRVWLRRDRARRRENERFASMRAADRANWKRPLPTPADWMVGPVVVERASTGGRSYITVNPHTASPSAAKRRRELARQAGLPPAAALSAAEAHHDVETPLATTEPRSDGSKTVSEAVPAAPEHEAPTTAQDGGRLRVLLLGPPAVIGCREEPSRPILLELLCYLAMHRERPVSGEELRSALWPDTEGSEAGAKSLRTYMSMLRRCVGADRLPEAIRSAGYRLSSDVETDWEEFEHLVARAGAEDELEPHYLREALRLVRGTPFAAVVSGTFTWAWRPPSLAGAMEVTIVKAARRLVELAAAAGEHGQATWAATRGLVVSPYDEDLWQDLLVAATRKDRHAGLERAWSELTSVIPSPPAALVELRRKLEAELARDSNSQV
jgi:DNA-binding SARP family transcriptional activator